MLLESNGVKKIKGMGKWFNQLFPLIQTRASCQPEQAIEPSSVHKMKEVFAQSHRQTEDSGFPTSGDSDLSTSHDEDNQEEAPPKNCSSL